MGIDPPLQLRMQPALSRREIFLLLLSAASLLFVLRDSTSPVHVEVRAAGTTFSQAGRVVIVTGASRGIGKGIAMVFAEAGASVLVTSRHMDEANATAAEIVSSGFVASAFEGDVVLPPQYCLHSRHGGNLS